MTGGLIWSLARWNLLKNHWHYSKRFSQDPAAYVEKYCPQDSTPCARTVLMTYPII